MLQGRGYVIALPTLATGTSDAVHLAAIVGGTDVVTAIGAIQGHFSNGDSSENVSFQLVRASASTPGASVTPRPTNAESSAATFAVSTAPTGVTLSPAEPLAVFGGNGAANFGWYPSVEEHQLLLKPAEILIVHLLIAPTSSLNAQLTINVTEI